MTSQADFISQANITSQAHTRARLTRPCFFMCFPMTSQADFTSQANITSQAGTRARLTRPWFFMCFSMTSQANITSQAYTQLLQKYRCRTAVTLTAFLIQRSNRCHTSVTCISSVSSSSLSVSSAASPRWRPRAVRGSVVGSSMQMWCPYGIGREIWDRGVLRIVC